MFNPKFLTRMKILKMLFILLFALGAYTAVEIYDDSGPPVEDTFIVDSNDFEMNVGINYDGVEALRVEPVESFYLYSGIIETQTGYDEDSLFEITPNYIKEAYLTILRTGAQEDVFNEHRGKTNIPT